jgi:hypothetical protein
MARVRTGIVIHCVRDRRDPHFSHSASIIRDVAARAAILGGFASDSGHAGAAKPQQRRREA